MAFDGITVACLVHELKEKLTDGRIVKIAQPESDELLLTIKHPSGQYRLCISSDASLPLVFLTDTNKTSPLTAPNFCMVLRKYLNNAKIMDISQPGLERIINFKLSHYNEMGDLCEKYLIVEIMGKHSNIIFTDTEYKIIDSIKRIPASISSLREVLPGRKYFIPNTTNKLNPTCDISFDIFKDKLISINATTAKSILGSFTGISPIIAQEISYCANIDSDMPINALSDDEMHRLFSSFTNILSHVSLSDYAPYIAYNNNVPYEFNSFKLNILNDLEKNVTNDSISFIIEDFYREKNLHTRINQKSFDIRRIITTTLEKDYKKYDLQLKQIKDTEKKDKYKVYGEMITTYGYQLSSSDRSLTCLNYYTNEDITVPLDPMMTPMENAKKYFDKYNKLKRTATALSTITLETKAEIDHLESLMNAMDMATSEDDLKDIKEEMILAGYIKRKSKEKKSKFMSKPLHYISSDGFHMYVGKNNIQNEDLTFNVANGGDMWFHSKTFPGSHVIVKTEGKELPDRTYEEAAKLAAFYSKGKDQDKVEIDYTIRKNVKKVAGAKPGFVIYHTNYSMAIEPDITGIEIL